MNDRGWYTNEGLNYYYDTETHTYTYDDQSEVYTIVDKQTGYIEQVNHTYLSEKMFNQLQVVIRFMNK